MRVLLILGMLSVALLVCATVSFRSKKNLSKTLGLLLVALVPPILGNILIIVSTGQTLATVGCYIYYIGLDWVIITLLRFTTEYCQINYLRTKWRIAMIALILVDILQLLANNFTGHAFSTEQIIVDGLPYFALVPHFGQYFHRVVVYGIFFLSIGIFVYKTFGSSKIYAERYAVILATMVFTGLWETYYIFSGAPIDRSMIGFGLFGILVFYFALYYKPFRLLDRMLSRVVTSMTDSVFFFDIDGTCIYGNDQGRSMIGLSPSDDMPPDSRGLISDALGGWNHAYNTDWEDKRLVTINGAPTYLNVEVQQVRDERGRHIGASMIVRDTTSEELRLQREKELARHDRLTGLYNKEYLYERVREELSANPDVEYYAVSVDVKDFKLVNDIFSKDFGDFVLKGIAGRMRIYANGRGVYGRLTGDKFGFITPRESFNPKVMEARLKDNVFSKDGNSHPVVIHMGVYPIDERDLAPSIMFDRAFMAVQSIKHDFQKHVAFYDSDMRESTIWNQRISAQLDAALTEGQIQPYLQPMVDENGDIAGAEVLVRWIHPVEGFLSPARFIPVFEDNGMIAKLDAYMWECACKTLKAWQARGIDMFLSVNISPKDFYFIDVYGTISKLVAQYGVNPAKLRLEITETVMMSDMENRMRILEDLRSLGFLVEMDDFGSGYSSLNMLKDMPVDVLKIDMMFLYKTKDQGKAQTILQTIINLSEDLGIPSVTEGVETADQHSMLLRMGCRMFQGYFFSKPMPLADFEKVYLAA